MGPHPIIDPLEGPSLALAGHVVTMDGDGRRFEDGVVYVSQGKIVAVKNRGEDCPEGFAEVPLIRTRGVIYPGLIDLHNHIAYNILPLWQVPQKFTDRNRWADLPEKRRRITVPMAVLARTPDLLPAIARYVEVKALLGGTTTTQGFRLSSAGGAVRFYRGLVRNVEQTEDPALRVAGSSIPDVRAQDAEQFLTKLRRFACYFLHLSEGTDPRTRQHFLDLQLPSGRWAVTDALAAIHAVALEPGDLDVLTDHHASVVWSPLSNYLLYGETLRLKSVRARKLRMGLGSDWSISGSKNILGELKVARLVAQEMEADLDHEDLVAMVTRDAARILRWDPVLGSLEPGKRADLLVLRNDKDLDPYAALIDAAETDILLVLINGVPRYGLPSLIKQAAGVGGEAVRVGGQKRAMYLEQKTADPAVGEISFSEARETLEDALHRLPELARRLDQQPAGVIPPMEQDRWHLALDEMVADDFESAPSPSRVPPQGILPALGLAGTSLESLVSPIDLDPPTVADDNHFIDNLDRQLNLPAYLKTGLRHAFA